MSLTSFMSKISSKELPRQKSVYKKDELIDLSTFTNLDDEFSLMASFLSESSPLSIELPLKASCVKVMQGDRFYAIASKEGHFAIIDSKEQVIVRDEIVKGYSVLNTLSLSTDEKFVFVAGDNPAIRMYSLDNFKVVKELQGHSAAVNTAIVSQNNEWLVSASDDNDVRYWSLKEDNIQKVLFTHSMPVRAICLTENNTYLASASEDCTSIIYELAYTESQESGQILATLKANHPLCSVKISRSNRLIVTGDIKGEIIIWAFKDWTIKKVYREKAPVRSIDISVDEKLMVTAGDYKQVYIWQIETDAERPILSLNGHSDVINSVDFSNDQQFIVSVSDDLTAIRWKIPYFEVINNLSKCEATNMWGVGDQVMGIAGNKMSFWDGCGKLVKSSQIPGYKKLIFTPDNFLYLFIEESVLDDRFNYIMQEYSIENLAEPRASYKFHTSEMFSVTISSDKKYLCIGEMYKISTFLIEGNSLNLINSQLYHDGEVYSLNISPNTDFLFSAGPVNNKEVIKKLLISSMNNTKERNELAVITEFKGKINNMVCTPDSSKLLYITNTELVIWSIYQEATIRSVPLLRPCNNIILGKNVPFFYTQYDNGLEVWDIRDFDLKSCINFKGLQCFTFFSDERMMAVRYKGKSECFESPMTTQHVKIIGEDVKNLEKIFFDYVRSIVTGKSSEYDHRFCNWMIMPFQMTIQHVYAYFNYENYLVSALLDSNLPVAKQAPYLKSANAHTVLSISLEQEFPECIKIALKCMRNRWYTNPYSLITVNDSLIELNNSGIDGLHKLYEFSLRKHFFTNLPAFCSDSTLPLVTFSNSLEVDSKLVLGPQANVLEGTAIVFEHTCFDLNMTLGSSKSVDFLESLIKCKNDRIFETKLIRLILETKWEKVRIYMYLQAFLYYCYMVTLTLFATVELNNQSFLIYPFGFNIVLFIYEAYQMYSGGTDYFKELWNYVDIVRSLLFVIYSILIWNEVIPNESDFLVVIIIASWIRGITYFRIYNKMRYLINLIFEVVKDLPAFLTIFIYAVIAFSFIFYALGDPNEYYWPVFVNIYSTTLGSPDTTGFRPIQWFFYLLITLFNFIIMLNLLISILSDTYSRVQDNHQVADGRELASMIMEIEMMMFWKQGYKEREFIHVCRDENDEETDEHRMVLGKFKTMNMTCEEYENDFANGIKLLEEFKSTVESQNIEIDKVLDDITFKFKF